MSRILAQIISISRGIGRRRRFLKKRQVSLKSIDDKWQTLQTQLRSILISTFQLSQDDVVDYPTFLQQHFDVLNKKLSSDSIHQFDAIIVSMRNIESFLSGMMAGYVAHAESLGSYSGLIYDSHHDSPVGGSYDDCDVIVVANTRTASIIRDIAEMSGKSIETRNLTAIDATCLNLHDTYLGEVVSICHS